MNVKINARISGLTLERSGHFPLRFDGQLIGLAGRCKLAYDEDGKRFTLKTSAQLFKTTGGKFVASVVEYDKTNQQYGFQCANVADTLEELAASLKGLWSQFMREGDILVETVNEDILEELFADTEVGDQIASQRHVEEIE